MDENEFLKAETEDLIKMNKQLETRNEEIIREIQTIEKEKLKLT
jgi:hypothetical protein